MGNRDSSIDIAKGICIFLMVLGHCFFAGNIRHYIYLFHMPFFFFVSGFFFSTRKTFSEFIIQKTRRLLVPFVIYWIFAAVINFAAKALLTHQLCLTVQDVGPLWFLISLWTIFVVSYVAVKYLKLVTTTILATIVAVFGNAIASSCQSSPFYIIQSLLMFPFFIFGNIIYRHTFNYNENKVTIYQYLKSTPIVSGALFVLSFIGFFFLPFGDVEVNSLTIPCSLSLYGGASMGIFLVMCISGIILHYCSKAKEVLESLGKNSLHVLGFHFPILTLTYYMVIPVYMRIEKFLSLPVRTGDEVKFNTPWLAVLISIFVTIIALQLGKYMEKRLPFLWGIKK